MCKQRRRLCKNILGLCKGAISQQKLLAGRRTPTRLRVAALNKPFHLVLIETFHFKFLTSHMWVCLSVWEVLKKGSYYTLQQSRHVSHSGLGDSLPLFHNLSLYLNSHWPHDVAWNQGINRDLGPACSRPLILGVPTKVPEQTKSWLHFSIWTHFLVVVLEFMAM